MKSRGYILLVLQLMGGLVASGAVYAAAPEFPLEIRDHLFYPAEIVVPANTKVKLVITNQDDAPEEFESYELNREKVIMEHSKTVIFIGPLQPGEYPFFGEFNPKTAQGKIIAK
jgi:hypothetical protein